MRFASCLRGNERPASRLPLGGRASSQSEPQPVKCRPVCSGEFPVRSASRSKPTGFISPRQPALAERSPAGPGWLHEIKFDGYRVIERKDGERVRFRARTTSDYSHAFTGASAFQQHLFRCLEAG